MFKGERLRGVRGWILGLVVLVTVCCVGGILLWGFATFGYADTLRGKSPGMKPPIPTTAQPPSTYLATPDGSGAWAIVLPGEPGDI